MPISGKPEIGAPCPRDASGCARWWARFALPTLRLKNKSAPERRALAFVCCRGRLLFGRRRGPLLLLELLAQLIRLFLQVLLHLLLLFLEHLRIGRRALVRL